MCWSSYDKRDELLAALRADETKRAEEEPVRFEPEAEHVEQEPAPVERRGRELVGS